MKDLEGYKRVQKLAYEVAVAVEKQLTLGITEKEVSKLMEIEFKKRGINRYFHRPFAWFAERSRFLNFSRVFFPPKFGFEFFPSNKKLATGMAVILDAAPIDDEGFSADIGHSFSFGENKDLQKAKNNLNQIRNTILELVNARMPSGEIYKNVDQMIHDFGYSNCHQQYPFGVLGHQVGKMPKLPFPYFSILGFGIEAFIFLLKKVKMPFIKKIGDRPLPDGLWAIEPHLGGNNFGAKFEEILVVKDGQAYWLDNNLPHVIN